uniref:Uncharacterized protein n=1 Tax=Octopus bimaculoides TaxID=37653 RepID=A0A0L8GDV5_OCTBM
MLVKNMSYEFVFTIFNPLLLKHFRFRIKRLCLNAYLQMHVAYYCSSSKTKANSIKIYM